MLFKQLGSGLVRVRTHHRKGTHVIADILDASLRNLLSFSQGTPYLNNHSTMLLNPRLLGSDSLLFLGVPYLFR